MEVCSSHRCAVSQHQRTAALFRAKCRPHCSVLLCKTGSKQAVCHCSHTYGGLLLIQVYSDPAPTHCSSVQGKMQSPLFSAALQNRLQVIIVLELPPMLYAVLPFLAAFPHILYQGNILLPQSLCSFDFHSASVVSRVSIWIQSCHHDASIAVVLLLSFPLSGLMLRVSAAPSKSP